MFEIINNYNDDFLELEILTNYTKFIVEKEKLDNCVFNVILVDDEFIKNLNSEYRNIDKTTDDFINAYINEFGETNEFDLIEVHKLIKLSYCLGLKKKFK